MFSVTSCNEFVIRDGKRRVAAVEQREAAFGDAVVVRSADAVFQLTRVLRVYDGFAAERSLALLDSCYKPLQRNGVEW